jgi:hypothetical protein
MNLYLDGKKIVTNYWKIGTGFSPVSKCATLEYDDLLGERQIVRVWAHVAKKGRATVYECFTKDPTAKEPVVQEVPDTKRKYTRKARK